MERVKERGENGTKKMLDQLSHRAVGCSVVKLKTCYAGEVHLDGVEQSCKPVGAGLTEPEELEKYIAIREEMYKKSKEFDSKIIGFETAIRRPYFHVKPLNDPDLDNWHNYLDFIDRGDDFNKVVEAWSLLLLELPDLCEEATRDSYFCC